MSELLVRPSSKAIKFRYFLCLLAAAAIFGYGRWSGTPLDLLLVLPGIVFLWSLFQHLALRYTTLRIAGGALRFEQGMLSRSTRSMELSKVQDVRVEQSLGQRILNVGNLTLESAGETGRLAMLNVDRPHEVANRILTAARER
jgi:uncharacterized membrane protein YdbT with pleckstrin-like domain